MLRRTLLKSVSALGLLALGAWAHGSDGTVGGYAVGQTGANGSIYQGYTLSWADDFLGGVPNLVGPQTALGAYFPNRPFAGGQGSLPQRGGLSSVAPVVDPLYTGYGDSNKGVAVGYSVVRQANSIISVQARRATSGESSFLAQPSVSLNVESEVNSLGAVGWYSAANAVIVEYYARLNPAAGSYLTGGVLSTWQLSGQPAVNSGPAADEFDQVETNLSPPAHTGANTWVGTTKTVVNQTNYSPDIQDANWHLITAIQNTTQILLYVDGVLKQTLAYSANTASLPSYFLLQAFTGGAGFTQSAWTSSGTTASSGTWIDVDYIRIWRTTGTPHYSPAVGIAPLNVDYGGSGTIVLPSKTAIWGDSSAVEFVQVVPFEPLSPGCTDFNSFSQFPPGISYNAGTRTISVNYAGINGGAGRNHVVVQAYLSTGATFQPLRITINRGPKVLTQAQALGNGTAYSYDLYWDCDVGIMTPKVISVSGLPSGLTFDGVSVVSGTVSSNGTTSVPITVTNNQGQSVTTNVNFVVSASIPTYIIQQNWLRGAPNSQSGTFYPGPLGGPTALTAWAYSRTGTGSATWTDGTVTFFPASVPRVTDQGWLVEGAATNLCPFATNIQAIANAWNTNSHNTLTPFYTDPTGIATAGQMTADGTSNQHFQQAPNVTFVNGSVYSFSVYVKPISGTGLIQLCTATPGAGAGNYANFTLSGAGSTGNSSGLSSLAITALTNGWYRISANGTSGSSSAGPGIFLVNITSTSDTRAPTNSSVDVLAFWGAQIEIAANPTSLVPNNTTGSASRGADVATLTYAGGTTATVTYGAGSTATPSVTSPLNVGSSSGGAWVGNYVTKVTVV